MSYYTKERKRGCSRQLKRFGILVAMDIVCLGEALIDFKAEDHLQVRGYEGGSPLNVAVTAARLGAKVGFATQLSTDMFGQMLRDYMRDNAVDTSFLEESDAPTTLAFVSERDGDAHFSFISNGAADTLYDPRPRPSFPPSVKFVQFGSKSLLDEPTASAITDIVALHQGRAVTVLDPNCRPALVSDKAGYEASLQGWLELATMVKVSTQDAQWLYPETPTAQVAETWLGLGPTVVIVTNGAEGVTLYRSGKKPVFSAAKKVEVVDTVGAGDTFTGGLMARLLERDKDLSELSGDDWTDVLSYAAHAAALTCTRAGANPPTKAELQAFMKDA